MAEKAEQMLCADGR